jgi:hypothetical protein
VAEILTETQDVSRIARDLSESTDLMGEQMARFKT